MPNQRIDIPGLEQSDFEYPALKTRQRVIYSVQGATKTGKSTFAFWGPSPIAVFDFDCRLEDVVQKAIQGKLPGIPPKDIVYIPFKMPEVDIRSKKEDATAKRQGQEALEKFLRNFKKALESSLKPGGVRTISIDTGTELMDVRLCAEFGRLVGIQPRDRGGLNQDMRGWMRLGENYNANIVWVHHVKDEWQNYTKQDGSTDSGKTGKLILDGYNKTDQCVQVNLETSCKGEKFYVKVVSSGLAPSTNGQTYGEKDWGDDGPFAYISQLQKPKSDIEDWLDE